MPSSHRFSGYAAPAIVVGTLYAALGGAQTTSDLYTLDPANGTETSVGAIGYAIAGLAFHPGTGVLYGVTTASSGSDPRSLISIDTGTGAGTLIGALGFGGGELADIGFTSAGALYGYRDSTRTLYSVNTSTGAATQVSATTLPFPFEGLGCDFDSTDLMFVFSYDDATYYTVDETTAANTAQVALSGSPTGGGWPIVAASFTSPAVLWAIDSEAGPTYLVTIDTSTGAVTNVGQILDDFDALAWTQRATAGAPHPN